MEIIKQEHQKEFDSEPVYDEKYLKAKMKSCKGKINKNVYNDKIPKKKISVYLFISNFERFCF